MSAVPVVDGVTGDVQRAAVGPQHILRGIGFGQSCHRVGPDQPADGRNCCGRCCGIVNPGVGGRRDRQGGWGDGSGRGNGCDRVVRTAVAVIHGVIGDIERAAVRTKDVLRGIRFFETGDRVGPQQATHCGGCSRQCRSVVNLGVGYGRERQRRRCDRPGRGNGCHRVVRTTVAIVDRVTGDVERAAVRTEHILRGIGFFHACRGVGPQQATHCGNCRSRSRCVIDFGVGSGGDSQRGWCDRSSDRSGRDRVVGAAVTIVDCIASDIQRAAIRSEYVLGGIGFRQASDRVGSEQPADRRNGQGCRRGIVDLGVGCSRDRQCCRGNRSCGAGGSHKVVAAAVTVIDCVAGYIQRAVIRSQHIFRRISFGQTGDGIRPLQARC